MMMGLIVMMVVVKLTGKPGQSHIGKHNSKPEGNSIIITTTQNIKIARVLLIEISEKANCH